MGTSAGIYVHVPFCRKRCIYCDFYSVGDRVAVWGDYVTALLEEASSRIHDMASFSGGGPKTLYIGGGTPSLMPDEEFRRLAGGLKGLLGETGEFTIEVNPDDVSSRKSAVWRECGVDRVSMGVQSLVDSELMTIGRRHDAATAKEAFYILRKDFDNISLDLMFGLPGQTLDSLRTSVEGVVDMNPEHISVYSLMYEERTALTRMRDSGKVAVQPEEDSVEMFRWLSSRLGEAGYEHYEISNYARDGFRSRHNSLYWNGRPYFGLGPGAHSYDGARTRMANFPDLRAYLSFWLEKKGDPPVGTECLGDDELREEMIMTRLRTREGLPLDRFEAAFGSGALQTLMTAAAPWLECGFLLLTENPRRLALTSRGVMVSDEIMASLF